MGASAPETTAKNLLGALAKAARQMGPGKEGSGDGGEGASQNGLGRCRRGPHAQKPRRMRAPTPSTTPKTLLEALAKAAGPMGPGNGCSGAGESGGCQNGLGRCCRGFHGEGRPKKAKDGGSGGRNPSQSPLRGAGGGSEADGAVG